MSGQDIKDARKRAASKRNKRMRDPFAQPCCRACGFSYPPIVQMHHVYPLGETEAPDDTCVCLCPNCHAMVHEIRRVYYASRRPTNLAVRLAHLDYWLMEVCPRDVADKLDQIARGATL